MQLKDDSTIPPLLRLGDHIAMLPIIHGSGQFAQVVRRWMLEKEFDALAVPLPPSFAEPVEHAVLDLPRPSIVIQPTRPDYPPPESFTAPRPWSPEPYSDADDADDGDGEGGDAPSSYVPIDPCQGVIMAIRAAMGEHLPRHYVDLETNPFRPFATMMPDPYAVRHVSPERFAAAVLPTIHRPTEAGTAARMLHMAARLMELEKRHQRVLWVGSVLHWPWIREHYTRLRNDQANDCSVELPRHDDVQTPTRYRVEPRTLMFLFGELPFITGLYERARAELEDDQDVQIDGVKELLIAARASYREELGSRARRITPLLLSKCLQYIRNLSLIHRRMTPDLVTIVTACQQILGDQFALHVAERANEYPETASGNDATAQEDDGELDETHPVTLGIDQVRLPSGEVASMVNRLPGPPMTWCTLKLQRRPNDDERERWQYRWNPYSQCSFPPEDDRIEAFRTRVFDRAQAVVSGDLARTEKFTTSVKDGIDIRDTLRHWYEKQIYVKVVPPARGRLNACVMLFDSPADPRDYPWRTTWFAEHENESTLSFFATNFQEEMVGPGIGLAVYGGALFLYPPVVVPDIWNDPRLDFCETLEERLIAAACLHSKSPQVALLSPLPPGVGFRRLAKRFKRHLVHVPLSAFSDEQVQQLRMVHVLNGAEVRSYAADFIRKA